MEVGRRGGEREREGGRELETIGTWKRKENNEQ